MVACSPSSLIFEKVDIPEEGLNISICEAPSSFLYNNCDFKLENSIKVNGRLILMDEVAQFKGKVATSFVLTCARCLVDFDFFIQSDIDVNFLPKNNETTEEELELKSNDLDIYYYDKLKINLFKPIWDQIVISIPIKPLCDINCVGLCSHCGQNLNKKKCGCIEHFTVDPRLAPLEKLKHLKENQ